MLRRAKQTKRQIIESLNKRVLKEQYVDDKHTSLNKIIGSKTIEINEADYSDDYRRNQLLNIPTLEELHQIVLKNTKDIENIKSVMNPIEDEDDEVDDLRY